MIFFIAGRQTIHTMTLVQPSLEQQAKIRSELNENVTTRDKDLEHIKEWLRRQPHLPYFDGKKIIQINS